MSDNGKIITEKKKQYTYNKKQQPQALPEPQTLGATPRYNPRTPSCLTMVRKALVKLPYCGKDVLPSLTKKIICFITNNTRGIYFDWLDEPVETNSPANRIFRRSKGCKIRVEMAPPETPAMRCSYLMCLKSPWWFSRLDVFALWFFIMSFVLWQFS